MKIRLPALAPFLLDCPQVKTLGIRPSFADYTSEEKKMMRDAGLVLFPSILHARTFQAAGIPTFPNFPTYSYRSSRLNQFMLFKMLALPHPRTKIYYGKKRETEVLKDFSLPFVVMCPSGTSPHGIREIVSPQDFQSCREQWNPLLVQELIAWEKKLKFVCTNYKIIGMSYRENRPSQKIQCRIDPSRVPVESPYVQPLKMTQWLLNAAQLDDICVEWTSSRNKWYITSLARPPVRIPTPDGTLNRFLFLCGRIAGGELKNPPLKRQWGIVPKDPKKSGVER